MTFTFSTGYWYLECIWWSLGAITTFIILSIEIKTLWFNKITDIDQQNNSSEVDSTNATTGTEETTTETRTSSTFSVSTPVNKSDPPPNHHVQSRLVQILPILSYLCFFLECVSILLYYIKQTEVACATGLICGIVCYISAKMFMSLVFIYRVKTVYSDSMFEVNRNVIYFMICFCISYSLVVMVWSPLSLNMIILPANILNGDPDLFDFNHTFCLIANDATSINMTFGALDFFTNTISFFLFIRPLITLIKIVKKIGSDDHKKKIFSVVQRSMILTFIATVSTVIALGIVAFTLIIGLSAIDIIVNCFCIMFCNEEYESYYKNMCCGAIKLFSKCCNFDDDEKNEP
eukprot:124948_1